jgi:GGDEF domain-containing protein
MSDLTPQMPARARPLADLPLDALLARAEELAKRWAITLLIGRPLERMSEIPFERLAGEAPALFAQAIRALESDLELDRLTGAGAPTGQEASAPAERLAAIAGARDLGEAAAAVEALRSVVWETMLEELRPGQLGWASPVLERAPARQLADLADRLACVCAAVVAVVVTTLCPGRDATEEARAAVSGGHEVALGARGRGDGEHDLAPSGGGATIVDERLETARPHRFVVAASGLAQAPVGRDERPLSWDESSPPVPPRAPAQEIEIRDQRREQGAAAWTRSIGRQLDRFEQDGRPFAALLVELLDVGRKHDDASLATPSLLTSAVEDALASELGAASGSVTQERPGRYWVLASETDRTGCERLAERLAGAAHSAMSLRGCSLEVAIGTAVCPDDGREAAALAAHADVDLYAARSAARATGARRAASVD